MERVATEWEWVHSGVGLSVHVQCLAYSNGLRELSPIGNGEQDVFECSSSPPVPFSPFLCYCPLMFFSVTGSGCKSCFVFC